MGDYEKDTNGYLENYEKQDLSVSANVKNPSLGQPEGSVRGGVEVEYSNQFNEKNVLDIKGGLNFGKTDVSNSGVVDGNKVTTGYNIDASYSRVLSKNFKLGLGGYVDEQGFDQKAYAQHKEYIYDQGGPAEYDYNKDAEQYNHWVDAYNKEVSEYNDVRNATSWGVYLKGDVTTNNNNLEVSTKLGLNSSKDFGADAKTKTTPFVALKAKANVAKIGENGNLFVSGEVAKSFGTSKMSYNTGIGVRFNL